MEEAAILCDQIAIMDRGKIITSGSPDQLLKDHFDDMILVLPMAAVKESLDGIEYFEKNDQAIIQTKDIRTTLLQLTEMQIDLRHMEIRSRNLEDLFLHLTGKGLRH